MRQALRSELSGELYELLNGRDLGTKQHEAMMLLTVTEEGWPHTAMISVGEVIAVDSKRLRLAIWPDTTTTNNIIRTEKATLALVYGGAAHYIKLALRRLPELPDAQHPRERFEAEIISARSDVAVYADLTTGIQIDLKDESSVIERWRETLTELML
ncbi:pyridoxamine 5'-phosphate oxidase family protein [Paenibacillus donghaensis]|uniref:pyridoxamine 5'-phosphate oxidase family protein n=1 Tax=Paenibacillus donghaensis TaxID=414771 RepID=UPI00188404B5|nr:pyridoxamine 5'-phosphate oxidase family protein [Paenibacillus donghaensis]MBE9916252.1 pyridoxamine 5'-phosphate oxidase family protein [Paenibacillus donghaensis]